MDNETREKTPMRTIYETTELDADQIKAINDQYDALGVNARLIDVSQFCSRIDFAADGSAKRSRIRKAKAASKPDDNKPAAGGG